jgi:hypothetical protein
VSRRAELAYHCVGSLGSFFHVPMPAKRNGQSRVVSSEPCPRVSAVSRDRNLPASELMLMMRPAPRRHDFHGDWNYTLHPTDTP